MPDYPQKANDRKLGSYYGEEPPDDLYWLQLKRFLEWIGKIKRREDLPEPKDALGTRG